MLCRGGLAVSLAVALAVAPAGQPQFDTAAGRQLAAAILNSGRSFQYVSELTRIAGPRLIGSATYENAVEWASRQFRDAGIERVTLEPFTIARGWERGSARGRILAPIDQPLHVESIGWMPSTPEGGLEGEVVAVNDFAPERIAAQRSVKGRIALLVGRERVSDPYEHGGRREDLDVHLRDAGAIAILSPDDDPGNQLTAHRREFGTDIGALPEAQIGRDDARTIRRLLDRGAVRIVLDLRNRITPGEVTVHNVLAEIRGREQPDEWIIVGAHLDSWDFATGAQDNGTGVAMVLEAARAIAASGRPPRRSIRFALWGGEEQGQVGSGAYVRAHAAELDRLVAMLNTDAGTGRVIGWTVPGRSDVALAVRPLAQSLLSDLGTATLDQGLQYAFSSDGAPFILAGIPTLDLNADDSRYEEIHHKTTDTIDRVDAHNLAVGAATVAVTAYAIAEAPQWIAPRLDRQAVARIFKKGS
jgi:carboxypeptidase Q